MSTEMGVMIGVKPLAAPAPKYPQAASLSLTRSEMRQIAGQQPVLQVGRQQEDLITSLWNEACRAGRRAKSPRPHQKQAAAMLTRLGISSS